MDSDTHGPMEAFETWLLRRVGRAVEAGDVSANLLNELITEVQVSRDKSQRESHTAAVQNIASEVGLSSEEVENRTRRVGSQAASDPRGDDASGRLSVAGGTEEGILISCDGGRSA